MNSAIYKINNMANNKCYIGSAVNVKSRWRQHKSDLYLDKHPNRFLQASWNKYHDANFKFEILEYCEKESLIAREQYWIDISNCVTPNGYNLNPKAVSSLGIKRSEETKAKISIINKGRKRTQEFKDNLSKIVTGRKHSTVAIENMIRAQSKVNKRKANKWPHDLGIKCKCLECKENKRLYMNNWRASKNGN